MKKTLAEKAFKLLRDMYPEFESGGIANEAKWADKKRTKFESRMKEIIDELDNQVKGE